MNTNINHKPPTHKLEELLFDVGVRKVYLKSPENSLKADAKKNAIVNLDEGTIISLVSNNYRLISNFSAIELGKILFRQIYPQTNTDDLMTFKVIAPKSRTFCHIDLIDNHVNFNTWEQETWLPFLRVSNSYNSSIALSYEIGFVRKLCSNGCLFEKDLTKIKYNHLSDRKILLTNDVRSFRLHVETFKDHCLKLKDIAIPVESVIPLVLRVFNIRIPNKTISKSSNFVKIIDDLFSLSRHYFETLGCNAYAAFNVMTDIVSHQEDYKNLTDYSQNVRSFYTKPSMWMEEFISQKRDLGEYLSRTFQQLEELRVRTGFQWELN